MSGVPPPIPVPPCAPPRRGISRPGLLVLSYLLLLGIVPLLLEKTDQDVRFHARQGLCMGGLYLAASWVIGAAGSVIGLFWALEPVLTILYLILVVVGIIKALNGERLVLPGITEIATDYERPGS